MESIEPTGYHNPPDPAKACPVCEGQDAIAHVMAAIEDYASKLSTVEYRDIRGDISNLLLDRFERWVIDRFGSSDVERCERHRG